PLGRVLELLSRAGQNVEVVDKVPEWPIDDFGEGAQHAANRRIGDERVVETTTETVAAVRLSEEVEGDG
ncbi:hypothetical protein PFISCL1PPCAC_22511, partial [Pristionchus fissidentatus]